MDDAYTCAEGANALVIVTQWGQFRALDLARLKEVMAHPIMVDLRNIYPPAEVRARARRRAYPRWRIRRATAIETDLLRIQAEILRERAQAAQQQDGEPEPPPPHPLYRALRAVIPPRLGRRFTNGSADEPDGAADFAQDEGNELSAMDFSADGSVDPSRTLTYCFLRLANPAFFLRTHR